MEKINIRQIITTIRVENPLKVISEKNKNTILHKIEDIYLKKCHDGVYIDSINKIITHSDITLSRFNLDAAGGNITVVFEANILQLNPGDIVLAQLEAIKPMGYMLISHNKIVNIIVDDNDPPIELNIGDLALVIITNFSYDTGQNHIRARAEWFYTVNPLIRMCVGPNIDITKIINAVPVKKIIMPGEDNIPDIAKPLKIVSEGNWGFWFKGDGTIMFAATDAKVPTSTEFTTASLVSMWKNYMDTITRISMTVDTSPTLQKFLLSE